MKQEHKNYQKQILTSSMKQGMIKWSLLKIQQLKILQNLHFRSKVIKFVLGFITRFDKEILENLKITSIITKVEIFIISSIKNFGEWK